MSRRKPSISDLAELVLILHVLMVLVSVPSWATEKKAASQWPEITEQEKTLTAVPQDPGADAVILRRSRDGKIVAEGRYLVNILDYHWRLKVLTEKGKDHAEVHIPSRRYAVVSDIEARTVKADGTVLSVAPDQIFEKLVQKGHGYKLTEFVFNFPAAEPGSILEYRYRRRVSNILYIEPWYFADAEFSLSSRMSQVIYEYSAYKFLCERCPSSGPESVPWSEGKNKGRLISLELKDIPAYKEELMMPPAAIVSPRLEMVLTALKGQDWEALGREGTLFTDWDSVAKWARYYYSKAYKLDEVLVRQTVAGWTQGIADSNEKIKAVFRHVTDDFRYQAYDDVYGNTPSISEMLKSRTADNEGKAVLLLAALRSMGAPANIALVVGKGKGNLNTTYYSLSQFSHAIVAVLQPDNSAIWLDPTVSYVPFGFMPWQDSGAGALYITDTGSALINLPQKEEVSATRYQVTVKPRLDGPADLEAVAEFQGEDAIEERQELIPASESARTAYMQSWLRDVRPGAALKTFQIEDLEALDKPLRIKMILEAPELITRAESLMLVHGCVLDCEDSNPISRGERSYPFYLDRGWNTEQAVTVVPPAGMRAATPPKPATAKSAMGSLTFSCSPQADGSVRCTRRFTAPRGRFGAGAQADIRTMYDNIVAIDRTTVALQEEAPAAGGGGR